MSTQRVDFLFRGAHPAFYWAAALLTQKGKTVAILPEASIHSWELFPSEVVSLLGLDSWISDRDSNPIQILSSRCRLGVFQDFETSEKDYVFSVGPEPSPEVKRGLAYYAKGSDYPSVFGETAVELLRSCHDMVYFEKSPQEIQSKVILHLQKLGIQFLKDAEDLPIAEQTVILDLSRAKIFRSKFEVEIPLESLPSGTSSRMVFVERSSPLIEVIHRGSRLYLRTLLPEEDSLPEKMIQTIAPYFQGILLDRIPFTLVPHQDHHLEWSEDQSNVDASKLGIWAVSPAINPELGERSLYFRLSELLAKKYKKQQVFEPQDLF